MALFAVAGTLARRVLGKARMSLVARPPGNQRRHRRATLAAPVLVDAANQYWVARCRDVSQSGLGVQLASPLEVGQFVAVYFELPTLVAIEAEATVARCADGAVGLVFHGLAPEQDSALATYCDQWLKDLMEQCSRKAALFEARARATAGARAGEQDFVTDEVQSNVRLRAATAAGETR